MRCLFGCNEAWELLVAREHTYLSICHGDCLCKHRCAQCLPFGWKRQVQFSPPRPRIWDRRNKKRHSFIVMLPRPLPNYNETNSQEPCRALAEQARNRTFGVQCRTRYVDVGFQSFCSSSNVKMREEMKIMKSAPQLPGWNCLDELWGEPRRKEIFISSLYLQQLEGLPAM